MEIEVRDIVNGREVKKSEELEKKEEMEFYREIEELKKDWWEIKFIYWEINRKRKKRKKIEYLEDKGKYGREIDVIEKKKKGRNCGGRVCLIWVKMEGVWN